MKTRFRYFCLRNFRFQGSNERSCCPHFKPFHLNRTFVFNTDDALKIINEKLSACIEWTELEQFVPKLWREDPRRRRTAVATNFAVSLEQARLKRIEIMQAEMFGPLYLRKAEEF